MKSESATARALSGQQVPPHYAELCRRLYDAATLGSIGHLLNWDQETYMPPAAVEHRSDQAAAVSALSHRAFTDPRIGDLIAACEADRSLVGDPASEIGANIREIRRDFDLKTKLPTELVAELAKVGSQAQEVWKEAREKSDFPLFRPWLERIMDLTRRKAECYGVPEGGELYDALLDEYEPRATARRIEAVFTPLREKLTGLVQELASSGKKIDETVLHAPVPAAKQHELGRLVLGAMGFDFEAGRLDTTTHPFCSGMAPGDTRLTTRYAEQGFADALYSTMHEGGHGLYEQNLPKSHFDDGRPRFGQPLGQAVSLGVHESQSRMWENFVGRSREFWVWFLPLAKRAAGGSLDDATVDQVYAAVNTAKPSYIRVESDEATYNLHVMLRFELERAIFAGDLKFKDLPGEWNALFKSSIGLDVPDDRHGCLQDVHWSFGLIGYFPTYTLGNLYAAQLWETILEQIPDLKAQMARGELGALKDWLVRNIHAHGRRYHADELCTRLTGMPVSDGPLMRHLEGKLRPLYR